MEMCEATGAPCILFKSNLDMSIIIHFGCLVLVFYVQVTTFACELPCKASFVEGQIEG
jgi:hypothetical protein